MKTLEDILLGGNFDPKPFPSFEDMVNWLNFISIQRIEMKQGLEVVCIVKHETIVAEQGDESSGLDSYSLFISSEGKIYNISRQMEPFNGKTSNIK